LPGATGDLLLSQNRSVASKRYYDANRQLTRRLYHEDIDGAFSSADTGLAVAFRAADTVDDRLSVPGDFASGTETITGLEIQVVGPDGGPISTDAGRIVIDNATGDLISETPQHPLNQYFAFGDRSGIESVCQAVGLP
jgi:hypothetical protein